MSSVRVSQRIAWGAILVPLLLSITTCADESILDVTGLVQQPASIHPVSGEDQNGVVGTALAEPIVVRLLDRTGKPVAGASVSWTVKDGGGEISDNSGPTNSAGETSIAWVLGKAAGRNRLQAAIGEEDSHTFTAMARSDVPASLAVAFGAGQRGPADSELTELLGVVVKDRFGNEVPGALVDWLVVEGGGWVNPAQAISDSSGLATTSWRLGPEAGVNRVVAAIEEEPTLEFTAQGEALAAGSVEGSISVPNSLSIPPSDLVIVTLAGSSRPAGDGTFAVNAPSSDGLQLLLASPGRDAPPVMLGLADGRSGRAQVSDTSTVLGLLMLNPYLLMVAPERRAEYLMQASQSPRFAELLGELHAAYTRNGEAALDYDKNPRLYQLVLEVMVETLEALGGIAALQSPGAQGVILGPPTVEDIPKDPRIRFVNPRFVHYGVSVHDPGGNLRNLTVAWRKKTIVSFKWGWPPMSVFSPEITEYELGDGQFLLRMAKGLDYGRIGEWQTDPAGRATLLNTAEGIVYIIEFLVGNLPKPTVYSLPNHFTVTSNQARSLGFAIGRGDAAGAIIQFMEIIGKNAEGLAYWVWQEAADNAAASFMRSAAGLIGNVALALKVFGFVNEQAPFFFDLFLAPKEVAYTVRQVNGTLEWVTTDSPPNPAFSITPIAGTPLTEFTVDASATTDDHDGIGSLHFRWDWESDGNWDTEFSTNPVASHTYFEAGAFSITLEVKDSFGHTAMLTRTVQVGGGVGTANRVKVFRTSLPWKSRAMETVLAGLGFSEGEGPMTFQILGENELGTADLVPGQDLVVISNDQPQSFYNAYARHQLRFENFIRSGGSVLWEACDMGWSEGSISAAGIRLPGGIGIKHKYDLWNYVVDPALPLTAGLPLAMDHNYASHESFYNLPDGTTVYMVDSDSNPTLIEFHLGQGWVVMTGQPLEHQYNRVYGARDMEFLIPRILSHFTGVHAGDLGVPVSLTAEPMTPADRSTAGEGTLQ